MHRERKRRRLIIFSLVMVLMLMIGGYAAFESKLDIKGSTKVTTNWEVLITNVTSGTVCLQTYMKQATLWNTL